jgi:hypothetical protein
MQRAHHAAGSRSATGVQNSPAPAAPGRKTIAVDGERIEELVANIINADMSVRLHHQ